MKSNKDRGAYFALFADPALSVGFLLKRLRRLDDGHGHVVVGFIVDRRSRGVGRGNLCHCCWTGLGFAAVVGLIEERVV